MSDRLVAWWRRTRPLLHPVSPDATLAWPLDQLAARVAAAMPLDLGGRVTIPEDFPRYLAVLGPHVSEAAAAAAARLARLPLAPEIDRLAGVLTRGSTVLVIREPDVPAEEELFG